MTSYAPGWTVSRRISRMFGEEKLEIEFAEVPDLPGTWEGWWPHVAPTPEERTAISGICLYDNRWAVEFKRTSQKAEQPAVHRGLVINRDREDALKRLGHGQRLASITVPLYPGEYHRRLLRWQASAFNRLKPKRILFHLPLQEYHLYLAELEKAAKLPLPWLHQQLDHFAQLLLALQASIYGEELMGRVTVIHPLESGATSLEESWLFPYRHPQIFGVQPEELMGVEDLPETRIAFSLRRELQREVPVLAAVLGDNHPYFSDLTQDGTVNILLPV